MLISYRVLAATAFIFCGAFQCSAQGLASLTFAYQLTPDAAPAAAALGSTIPFPATTAGVKSTVNLIVTNKGVSAVTISSAAVSGNAFSISPNSMVTVGPNGGSTSFSINFAPTASGPLSATLTLLLASGESAAFQVTGTGLAPNFVTSYILNPDGNQVQVADQGTINFPLTSVGQSSTATFVISNQGTGAGTVTAAVVASGSAYRITGLQLLPAQVAPGAELRFTVVFAPQSAGSQTGTLRIDLPSGARTITLQGQGLIATLKYEVITSTGSTQVNPGDPIAFPDTAVGVKATINIRITNVGNATGQVQAVTVAGAGFTLASVLPSPITLVSGAATVFTIAFSPNDVGKFIGTLLIDAATFSLQGTGLGPKLTFNFHLGSTTTPVSNNGTANFSNTTVGTQTAATLEITNDGNVSTTVSNISVAGNAFIAVDPSLPATLASGASLTLPLIFKPNAVGTLTGVLTIDSVVINLRGTGTAPSKVTGYSITGLGSTVAAQSQPQVGLTLSQPYPADITGQLTLTFTSGAFVDDTAIQFATGGRTAGFRIPANTTTALFGANNSSTVQLQSGTVAGTISVNATFNLGSVDISPQQSGQSVMVLPGAPQLLNAQIGTTTATTFEILLTGYATNRSVTNATLAFAPAATANLQTTTLSVDVSSAFSTWYQSPASQQVGSQFTASVTVNISGGTIDAVKSVSATLSNSLGTSQAANANLH